MDMKPSRFTELLGAVRMQAPSLLLLGAADTVSLARHCFRATSPGRIAMHSRMIAIVAAVAYLGLTATATAQQPITLRAGMVIDGKGNVQRNAVITIEGSRIV